MAGSQGGIVRRFFRWLFSPSASWSVAALLVVGLVLGVTTVAGSQVALHLTGSDEFCGNACHSHEKFVFPEHKLSAHYTNRTGVRATCSDCHVPHNIAAKVLYKAKAGVLDAISEAKGTISTQEKFDKERWRMANHVWDEMKANNSANCRTCHDPSAWSQAKQSEDAQKQHKKFFSGKATCIECHQGVAHKEPEEPKDATKAADASK
jgi:nitrate/TMAO reductase-like tetraheme cytochrome c subunit